MCSTGGGGIGGLRWINTCHQVRLLVKFSEKPTLRVWCLYRYLVHVPSTLGNTSLASANPRRRIRMSAFLAWRLGGKIALRAGFFFFSKPTAQVAGWRSGTTRIHPSPPPLHLCVMLLSSLLHKARVSYAIRMSHNFNTVRLVQKLC